MAKRERRTNELIHCENCGEDYAATYRCCPFCEERPTRGRGGGSRLRNNTRGGGYGGPPSPLRVLGWVVSLALIIAACVIVFNMLGSLLGFGGEESETTPTPPATENVSPTPDLDSTTAPSPTPDSTPTPEPTPTAASVSAITLENVNAARDITLQANEQFTFVAAVTPSDWGGTVVWTSDSAALTITENGVATNVNTGSGTVEAHVTATAGDQSVTCIVRCRGGSTGGATTTTPSGGATTSAVTLNRTDFTIRPQDPSSVQIRASGGDGTYAWSSSDTSVATVSSDGLVTKVGQGTCTITCTSGGSSATCTVRVS